MVSIGCCCFSFLSLEGWLFYFVFTRRIAEITDFLCPEFSNFRIFSSHGMSRRSRFFSLSRIFEFSNFFFTRRIAEITDFLCPDFFPCPEFANCFLHTECRGIIFFITNYRIIEYLSHGESRRSRIFFVPRLVLGPTDRREVIAEFLSITRSVADGCGACSSCEWGLFVVVYRPIRVVCV